MKSFPAHSFTTDCKVDLYYIAPRTTTRTTSISQPTTIPELPAFHLTPIFPQSHTLRETPVNSLQISQKDECIVSVSKTVTNMSIVPCCVGSCSSEMAPNRTRFAYSALKVRSRPYGLPCSLAPNVEYYGISVYALNLVEVRINCVLTSKVGHDIN